MRLPLLQTATVESAISIACGKGALSKVHSGMDQSDVDSDLRSIARRDLSSRANPCGWGVLGPSDLASRPADKHRCSSETQRFPMRDVGLEQSAGDETLQWIEGELLNIVSAVYQSRSNGGRMS
jgi:hypothetical protein